MGVWHLVILGPRGEKIILARLQASCFSPWRSPRLEGWGRLRPCSSPCGHSASLEVPAADSAGGSAATQAACRNRFCFLEVHDWDPGIPALRTALMQGDGWVGQLGQETTASMFRFSFWELGLEDKRAGFGTSHLGELRSAHTSGASLASCLSIVGSTSLRRSGNDQGRR